jgi:3-oxoacyl-(acyl-carrier-protein) synthase/malonyl CoA-acyl carrier protein transacylase
MNGMSGHEFGNAVAIVGAAGIFPGSRTTRQFFENTLRLRCFVREIPDWLWEQEIFYDADRDAPLASYTRLAGLLGDMDLDVSRFRIPPSVAAYMSRNQKLAMICTEAALRDAGYLDRGFNREKTGVVIGAVVGESAEKYAETLFSRRLRARFDKLAQTPEDKKLIAGLWDRHDEGFLLPVTEDSLSGAGASLVAGRIASTFDLHGPNLSIDSACASTLAAVSTAVGMLRSGVSDLVITGGAETDVNAGYFVGFSKIGALSAQGSFPFDRRADGFVMGEGCGIFVLKRHEDALRDGDRIHALIRGWGSSSDGAGKGITAPSSDGQLRALQRAYEDASLSPADLSYVECHGTGTQVGDASELQALGNLMQGHREEPLPIGSVKAMIGHLKTASGAAGLFRGLLVANSRLVPPQVGYESPNEEVDWNRLRLRVPVAVEKLTGDEAVVGVSSFGFGGTNFHMVLSSATGHARPAMVCAERYLQPELPPLGNDIAFLFPGQGSQYVGMLGSLRDDPVAMDFLDKADRIALEVTGKAVSQYIYPDAGNAGSAGSEAEQSLQKPSVVQPALFLISAILLERVRRKGIECGMAIGHSLGELTALYAAGYFTFEDALRMVAVRGKLTEALTPDSPGKMAFVNSGVEDVEAMLAQVEGYLTCANLNSYQQTVVSGDADAIDRLIELATSQGLQARLINVDRAFHSQHTLPVKDPFRAALEGCEIFSTSTPVPSHEGRVFYPLQADKRSTGRPMADADRSRFLDLVSRQVASRVDFISQIESAYQAGIRRFVEIGPRSVLTGLVDDILQGKAFQAIYLDRRSRTGARLDELPELLQQPLKFRRRPLPTRPRDAMRAEQAGSTATLEGLNVADGIRQVVAAVSGYAISEIRDDAEFERDLGIDTLKIFDIISRLRGKVLPRDFREYRRATSIQKILDLADAETPGDPHGQNLEEPAAATRTLHCYRLQKKVLPPSVDVHARPADHRYALILPVGLQPPPGIAAGMLDDEAADTLMFWPLPATAEALANQALPALLEAVKRLDERARHAPSPPQVHILSHAAPDGFSGASYLSLSGLVKSFQLDLPHLRFSYCHLDTALPDAAQVSRALSCRRIGEHLLADGSVEIPALAAVTPMQLEMPKDIAALLGPDDLVLVTGGARGIAARIVQFLLAHTAARFLLVGRKAQTEPWIVEQGAGRIEYLQADLTDANAVHRLDLGNRPITLLIHAAGVVISRSLQKVKAEELRTVLGTKVLGLRYLLDSLDRSRLRGIVNFSSTAGYFGAPGNFDYAAANGFLNGFNGGPVPVLSIAWSAWDEVGMASDDITREFMRSSGIDLIPVRQGAEMFTSLLGEFLRSPSPGTTSYAVHAGMADSCFIDSDPLRDDMVSRKPARADGDDLGFQVTELNGSLLGMEVNHAE